MADSLPWYMNIAWSFALPQRSLSFKTNSWLQRSTWREIRGKPTRQVLAVFVFFWVLLIDLSHCFTHASLMTTAKMGGGKEKKKPRNHKKAPFHRIMSAATTRRRKYTPAQLLCTGTYTSAKKMPMIPRTLPIRYRNVSPSPAQLTGPIPVDRSVKLWVESWAWRQPVCMICTCSCYFKARVLIARQFLLTPPLDPMYICTYDEHLESKDEFKPLIMSCMP